MSLKYGIMEIDQVKMYALSVAGSILTCYQVQQTEEGPKLDLPPPDLLASTAFAYAEALYAKEKEVAKQEAED